MDMLHLVPAALLSTIGLWLLWPVIADPIARRRRSARARDLEQADSLADALFENWGAPRTGQSCETARRG